jgi:hypothetical protein
MRPLRRAILRVAAEAVAAVMRVAEAVEAVVVVEVEAATPAAAAAVVVAAVEAVAAVATSKALPNRWFEAELKAGWPRDEGSSKSLDPAAFSWPK